jgi:hypothetical protein
VELVGRFDPVTVYDTGDPTDTLSVVGERVREGEEEELQLELVQVEEQFELVQLQLELVQVEELAGVIVIVVCIDDPRTSTSTAL